MPDPSVQTLAQLLQLTQIAVGLLGVTVVLLLFLVARTGKLLERAAAPEASPAPVAPAPAPAAAPMVAAPAPVTTTSEHLAVVLAAATHCALQGERHRIVSIAEADGGSSSWATEGRRAVFSSHRVR